MIPIAVKRPARLAARQNDGSKLLRVEDTSWRLQYGGQWSPSSIPVDQDHDDDLSVHISSQSGSTIKFAFNGTFIGVYGVLDGASYDATFTLDDEPPARQTITEPPPTAQINWPFFSTSTPLEPGLHELTMTLNQGTFKLDYIQYTSINGLDDVGDAAQVQPGSPDGTPSPGPLPQRPDGGTKLSTGVVAGVTVAAAVIVLGVVAILLRVFYRRARRVRHQRSSPEKPLDILHDTSPKSPSPAARGPFRRFSRIYRPRPPRSAQSSKTATSSAPTSITQSTMFTSVIMLSPALSMVSEEGDGHSHV
ncbi:hypothetical protein C8Q80DRAFT_352190 [Daedaleopsis nitida]|nr:hypothetical protein C8Q80DRAFT_352190 [Daedaleopsis nitida]